MTEKRMVGSCLKTDDTSETWSRVSKLSQEKFAAKKYSKRRKHPQSPHLSTSLSCRKDFETPKRGSRKRFNGCSTGDSPSETEALQDIIWDPASPPPAWNEKGTGEGVEISDLVKRIAPRDEKPVERDLVLQWIGDSAIPCTPEIQLPRIRRVSARRQSSNIEDLMKLAKEFDISMTRQDKERQLNNEEMNTEQLNILEKSTINHPVLESNEPSPGAQASVPVKSVGLTHEEELHALFDGPTQYGSERLSPPSLNSSQESRSQAIKPSSHQRSVCPQVPKPDFDDDWENDDLLNDSFVLEMTQNSELLSSAVKKSTDQRGYGASKKCELANMAISSVPCSRARDYTQPRSGNICPYTRVLSKAQCTSPGTYRTLPNACDNTGVVQQFPKTSPDPSKPEKSENHRAQAGTSPPTKEIQSKGHIEVRDSDNSSSASALDSVWGDGDDDNLLYQACDDAERISNSQEQQMTGQLQEASRHGHLADRSGCTTFRRHRSDPVVLGSKVFVAAQPVRRCSAAEIERKKQEAIARRRLRLKATKKTGFPA